MQQILNQLVEQLIQFLWAGGSMAGKVLLAAFLGGIIGLERELRGRDAGLRTNILVAMASCLFTILSIEGFPLKGAAQDTGRVAAQIVSGVGFLGAGVLLRTRGHVRGLTTAATIWLVAAVGMAVGTESYVVAVFTAILAMLVLQGLRPIGRRLAPPKKKRQRSSEQDDAETAEHFPEN